MCIRDRSRVLVDTQDAEGVSVTGLGLNVNGRARMKVAAVGDAALDERSGCAELRDERVRTVDPVEGVDPREVARVDAVKRGQLLSLIHISEPTRPY